MCVGVGTLLRIRTNLHGAYTRITKRWRGLGQTTLKAFGQNMRLDTQWLEDIDNGRINPKGAKRPQDWFTANSNSHRSSSTSHNV